MASEDLILRLDINNYDDEIYKRIDDGDINREDLIDFLAERYISINQFIDYIERIDYIEGISDGYFD